MIQNHLFHGLLLPPLLHSLSCIPGKSQRRATGSKGGGGEGPCTPAPTAPPEGPYGPIHNPGGENPTPPPFLPASMPPGLRTSKATMPLGVPRGFVTVGEFQNVDSWLVVAGNMGIHLCTRESSKGSFLYPGDSCLARSACCLMLSGKVFTIPPVSSPETQVSQLKTTLPAGRVCGSGLPAGLHVGAAGGAQEPGRAVQRLRRALPRLGRLPGDRGCRQPQ